MASGCFVDLPSIFQLLLFGALVLNYYCSFSTNIFSSSAPIPSPRHTAQLRLLSPFIPYPRRVFPFSTPANFSFFFFFSSFLPPLQLLTLSSPAAPHSLPTSMALSWPANTNLEQPFLSSHFLCCSTAPHHSFLLSPATKFLPPNLFVFSPVSGSSHLCLS